MSKSGRSANTSSSQKVEEDAGPKPLTTTLLQQFENLKDKFKNEDDSFEKGNNSFLDSNLFLLNSTYLKY